MRVKKAQDFPDLTPEEFESIINPIQYGTSESIPQMREILMKRFPENRDVIESYLEEVEFDWDEEPIRMSPEDVIQDFTLYLTYELEYGNRNKSSKKIRRKIAQDFPEGQPEIQTPTGESPSIPSSPAVDLPETQFTQFKKAPPGIKGEQPALPTIEMETAYRDILSAKQSIEKIDGLIAQARKDLNAQIQQLRQSGNYNELLQKQADATNKLAMIMEEAGEKLIRFGDDLAYLDIQTKQGTFTPDYKWKLDIILEKFGRAKRYLDKMIEKAKQEAAERTEQVRRLIQFPDKRKRSALATMDMNDLAEMMTDINQFISELDGAQQEIQQLELDLGIS